MNVVDHPERPLILFDGVCHLCNRFVRFILERDATARFDFAPLQSPIGREKLGSRNWDSLVLVEGGRLHEAEAGVLRVLSLLRRPWPSIAAVLGRCPKPLLAWAYRTLARHRYALFGREEFCGLPLPEWKGRFLS